MQAAFEPQVMSAQALAVAAETSVTTAGGEVIPMRSDSWLRFVSAVSASVPLKSSFLLITNSLSGLCGTGNTSFRTGVVLVFQRLCGFAFGHSHSGQQTPTLKDGVQPGWLRYVSSHLLMVQLTMPFRQTHLWQGFNDLTGPSTVQLPKVRRTLSDLY